MVAARSTKVVTRIAVAFNLSKSSNNAEKALPPPLASSRCSKNTVKRCSSAISAASKLRIRGIKMSSLSVHSSQKWSRDRASAPVDTATEILKIPIRKCSKIGRPVRKRKKSDGASTRRAKRLSNLSLTSPKGSSKICINLDWRKRFKAKV